MAALEHSIILDTLLKGMNLKSIQEKTLAFLLVQSLMWCLKGHLQHSQEVVQLFVPGYLQWLELMAI